MYTKYGEEHVHLIGTARHTNRLKYSESPEPPKIFLGDRGRPRYLISRDQVEFLLERCFSVVDIASLLGVSVRTLERRLSEFGLRARSTNSDISDQALDYEGLFPPPPPSTSFG